MAATVGIDLEREGVWLEYDAANTLRDLMCERTELESLLPHCIKDCSSVSVLYLSEG